MVHSIRYRVRGKGFARELRWHPQGQKCQPVGIREFILFDDLCADGVADLPVQIIAVAVLKSDITGVYAEKHKGGQQRNCDAGHRMMLGIICQKAASHRENPTHRSQQYLCISHVKRIGFTTEPG